jgi:hypothetical protein
MGNTVVHWWGTPAQSGLVPMNLAVLLVFAPFVGSSHGFYLRSIRLSAHPQLAGRLVSLVEYEFLK